VGSDGRIVVTGYSWRPDGAVVVARYTAAGQLDRTFSGDGKVVTDVSPQFDDTAAAVAVAPSGKILVAGTINVTNAPSAFPYENDDDLLVVRYRPNGSLDTTLQGRGWAAVDVQGSRDAAVDATLLDSGTLLVAGGTTVGYDNRTGWYDIRGAVTAIRADGQVAASFGASGTAWAQHGIDAMAVQGNGRIVVVGGRTTTVGDVETRDSVVSRFQPDGRPDAGFGAGGEKVISFDNRVNSTDWAVDVAVDTKSRVYVLGDTRSTDVRVARLTPRGALDAAFGTGGVSTAPLSADPSNFSNGGEAIALQGVRPLVAGDLDGQSFLVRYLAD
jgi:uncharacterized delta-60 repeat protein